MTHLIQIGNSQGVRIPKALIEQAGLQDVDLKLEVVPEGILITPCHQVRQGWAEAFRAGAEDHETKDIKELQNLVNMFDEDEWEW